MLCVAGQQVQGVRQQRQDGAEAVLSARRAPGKVDDERTSCDAADAAAEGCKGRLLNASKANLFSDAGNEAIAHFQCRFRSHVAFRQAGAACRKYQICRLRSVPESRDEQIAIVRDNP